MHANGLIRESLSDVPFDLAKDAAMTRPSISADRD